MVERKGERGLEIYATCSLSANAEDTFCPTENVRPQTHRETSVFEDARAGPQQDPARLLAVTEILVRGLKPLGIDAAWKTSPTVDQWWRINQHLPV